MPEKELEGFQIQLVSSELQSSFFIQPAVRVSGREVRRSELEYQKPRMGVVLEIRIQCKSANDGQRRIRLRDIAGPQGGDRLDDGRRNSS
jgi:hypothetical protein